MLTSFVIGGLKALLRFLSTAPYTTGPPNARIHLRAGERTRVCLSGGMRLLGGPSSLEIIR